jgi:hypothetical protein
MTTYSYTLKLKDKMSAALSKAGARSAKTYSKMQRAQSRLNAVTKRFAPISNRALGVIGVASVGALTSKIVQSTIKTAAFGDEMSKLGRQVGMSSESIQRLRYVAERQGVSQDKLNTLLTVFGKRLGEAQAGTGSLYSRLNKLNPALLKQLQNTENVEDAFYLYMDSMKGATSEAQRMAYAQAGFSRSGLEMTRVAELGSKGIRALGNEAQVMTDKQTAASEGFLDAQAKLNNTFNGLKILLSTQLMPIIQKYMNKLREWIMRNKELIATKIKSFIQGIADAISWLSDNMTWIIPVAKIFVGVMVALKVATIAMNIAMMSGPWGWILGAIALVILGIAAMVKHWDKLKAVMMGMWEVFKSIGSIIKLYLLTPFQLLGELLIGIGKTALSVFAGDFEKAAKQGGKTFDALKGRIIDTALKMKKQATGLGEDFQRGYQKGMALAVEKDKESGLQNQISDFKKGKTGGNLANNGNAFDMMNANAGETSTGLSTATAETQSAGRTVKNVKISLNNLVENINIARDGFEASIDNMEEQIKEALLRVLNSANSMQNE